jgi:hypothetical protein
VSLSHLQLGPNTEGVALRIVLNVAIDTPSGPQTLCALVDLGCSINLINQEVVLCWNLACDMQAACKPVARFLDDNLMQIWDAHSLSVTTKDSEGDELMSEL